MRITFLGFLGLAGGLHRRQNVFFRQHGRFCGGSRSCGWALMLKVGTFCVEGPAALATNVLHVNLGYLVVLIIHGGSATR